MPADLIVVEHPVLEDRLAVLRDAATGHGAFRQALHEASAILAIEATRDLPTVEHEIDTPLEPASVRRLEAQITIVPCATRLRIGPISKIRLGFGLATTRRNLSPSGAMAQPLAALRRSAVSRS